MTFKDKIKQEISLIIRHPIDLIVMPLVIGLLIYLVLTYHCRCGTI